MPYVEGKGVKIYYEEIGVGEPVIFLHSSFSRGIVSFSTQIMDLQNLRCIYPDLRHGRTEVDILDWILPDIADDIILLMDSLKIKRAHLVGFSFGGYVAFYCAIKYPDRVKSITSIGSVASYNDINRESAKGYDPEYLIQQGKTKYIELLKVNHTAAHKGDWRSFIKRVLFNWENYCYIPDEQLKKIICPCMIIVGEKDNGILPDELKRIEDLLGDIKILKVEGCGHGPHVIYDKPLAMNKVIQEYIESYS